MPRLRQNEREQAIGMLAAGMTQVQVANHFNVSRMAIARLKTRLRDTGTTIDRPRSGRPRETTLRQDRHIRIIHLWNRFVNALQTARQTHGRHNNRISDQIVRNRLRQAGLRARRPLKGPYLRSVTGCRDFNGLGYGFDGIGKHGDRFFLPMNLNST
ncbi:unnamed protein product [Mytilus coruscus]|uniref:Transposase IS30-like HTH domain-containing protein n=1 Tax=Mytilus coruscus TaxID=42192 RepID=A0A6J8C8C5_MYTCO|nr:unnamed protein product [Mytilus coruscus]